MTNTSATGGYLVPSLTLPTQADDAALTDFIQSILVSLTGIAGNLVRPRWQPVPANIPDINTNWCAFGIMKRPADTFAYEGHEPQKPNGNGFDYLLRQEELDVLCSFYGSNANYNATMVRDGLQVAQNREALYLASMSFVSAGDLLTIPDLRNTQWYMRVDITITFRRGILRSYPVLNLLTASGTVSTGNLTQTFIN